MAVEVLHNKEICGGGKNGGVGSAIRRRANRGSIDSKE